MKVIITGGEGFIGKALAIALSKHGVEVVSVDRANGREDGEYFTSHNLAGVDCVYHLAAQTSVFNENKTDILRDNVEVFKIVCDACTSAGVKLVYASSSTAAPGNTTSLYGISRHFNEQYAHCYNKSACGVRFHNVYGPNPRQGTLLWNLFNQKRVKLYNMGRNVRHFTYIDNIVESLVYAYGCSHQLINAANPEETTTLHLAELVKQYKPLEIEMIAEERDFDRKEQSINEAVYTVPLQYTPVADGIRRILQSMDYEQTK